ncbi:MAG TPA: M48 family metalloprotease [bacterium]
MMRAISKVAYFAALTLVFLVLNTCATNPVTGKKELSLLSFDQEVQLGLDADKGIVAEYGLYDDTKIAEFVEQLGQRMAKVSHRPTLEFHFRVLDSPVINAFALPGGFVYITRGILAYMNSEAELAGVMGHEIGHVTARHGAKAYTRAQLAQVGLGAAFVFSETFRQYSDVAQLGVGLLFLRFSRDQERQSDELGVQYSTALGYDAADMSKFFGTLNRLQDESSQSLPGWFSTHPNPEDREAKTLELARAAQQKSSLKDFKKERDEYLALIDGIVFGEDPRQGFVENGYFYHPTLDFQFPVPRDWQVVNTPQAVQMVNKEQTAGMQFSLAQETGARAAADKFVADTKGQVTFSDYARINGMVTEIRETVLTGQEGSLKVLSYFFEKGKYVFVFHGFSALDNYGTFQSAFKQTMVNFDRLKNEQARTVKPTRLKVVTATRSSSLKDFLAHHLHKKVTPDKFAIINGMALGDAVKPGDRIKVLTE